ncbi:myb domain-containing protein, partial [Reticulomyxa filosa]
LSKSDPTDHQKKMHRLWDSNMPMLTHAQDVEVLPDEDGVEHTEILKVIRKELSSIIENLTEIKLRRLQNIKEYWDKNVHDSNKLADVEKEFTETEEELAQWRRDRSLHEEQEQKIERRKSLVASGIATPLDFAVDEELEQTFEEYDPKEDFTIVKGRFVDLNRLYWLEDQIVSQRFEHYYQGINTAMRERARTIETFEHQMVQMKNLFSNRPSQELTQLSGGDFSSQESEGEIIQMDDKDPTKENKHGSDNPVPQSKSHAHNPPVSREEEDEIVFIDDDDKNDNNDNDNNNNNNSNNDNDKAKGPQEQRDNKKEADVNEENDNERENIVNEDDIALGDDIQSDEQKKLQTKMKLELRRFTETHQKEVDTFIYQIQRKDKQIQTQKEHINNLEQQVHQLKQYVHASQSDLDNFKSKMSVRMSNADISQELRQLNTANMETSGHNRDSTNTDHYSNIQTSFQQVGLLDSQNEQESPIKETDFQPVSGGYMSLQNSAEKNGRRDTEVDSMRSEENDNDNNDDRDNNENDNDDGDEKGTLEQQIHATMAPIDVKNTIIEKLQRNVQELEHKLEDLTRSKLELINNTCLQMEKLRDQITAVNQYAMTQQKSDYFNPKLKHNNQTKENISLFFFLEIKKSIRFGDDKKETASPSSWFSFSRSKFSSPALKYEAQDVAKSKIKLPIAWHHQSPR